MTNHFTQEAGDMKYILLSLQGETIPYDLNKNTWREYAWGVKVYTVFEDAVKDAENHGNCDVVELHPIVRVRTEHITRKTIDPIIP